MHMCLLDRTKRNTVEPRFNEVAGERPNLFVKWRVRSESERSFPNGRGSRVAGFKSRVAGFKKVAGFEKVAGFQKSRVVKRLYYMNITKNKIYTL